MKITAIKAQVKNENRVSIFLDGTYSFSLTLDQLLEQKLKKGSELEENAVKNLKKLSDEGKMRQRAIEWAMGRPHSTRELRDYLYRKKIEKDFMEQLINDFTEKAYIDDYKFAEYFAESRRRKNKSNRAISAELNAKGVSRDIAQQVVDTMQDEAESDDYKKTESDALNALIVKVSGRSRYQDQQKLKMYLLSKGFSYAAIKDAIEKRSNIN